MYVSILSGALDRWDFDLEDDELLDYVRLCRRSLPEYRLGAGTISASVLAAEIAYDRALVCLAAQLGIDVSPANFMHPSIERDRLEVEVIRRGVRLDPSASSPATDDARAPGGP